MYTHITSLFVTVEQAQEQEQGHVFPMYKQRADCSENWNYAGRCIKLTCQIINLNEDAAMPVLLVFALLDNVIAWEIY